MVYANGGRTIASAPMLPLYADVAGSVYPAGLTWNPPTEYWRVKLKPYDRLKVDFSIWSEGNGGVGLCLYPPQITDFTVNDARCTARAYTGDNGYGELKHTVNKAGTWTLAVEALWCCGDPWGYEINLATVSPVNPPGPTGGYPWANALCKYGAAGGTQCTNGKSSFDWGYRVGPYWQGYNPRTGGFAYRNCTDFVAWRLRLKAGQPFNGDAGQWRSYAVAHSSWVARTSPHVGDIAWWGNFNHVAVVSEANSRTGLVTVSEYNWPVVVKAKNYYGMYGTRKLARDDPNYPQAFLHKIE